MPSIPFLPPPPLHTSLNSPTFANDLAKYICDFYVSLNVRSARPDVKRGQWSVLAGFVLFVPPLDSQDDNFAGDGTGGHEEEGDVYILTLATGLKCLPKPLDREIQVVDMHAEILARRELELFLQIGLKDYFEAFPQIAQRPEEIQLPTDKPVGQSSFPLWVLQHLTAPTIPISAESSRKRAKLILYSSTNFCGSASDEAHLMRMDEEDRVIREILWGSDAGKRNILTDLNAPDTCNIPDDQMAIAQAAPSMPLNPNPNPSTYRHLKSLLQPPLAKKPSRPDAPPTPSYSCSDKLSRYQLLGFQGGRLAGMFEKLGWEAVRVEGVVIGEDYGGGGGLGRMFGGGDGAGEREGYCRMREGVEEMLRGREADQKVLYHLEPLKAITTNFQTWQTTHPFPYSRQSAILASPNPTPNPTSTPLTPTQLTYYRALPLPLARAYLLPPSPALTPFPIASTWHAGGSVEVLSPAGRVNGVGVEKGSGEWGARSWSRVCRRGMEEGSREVERLVEGGMCGVEVEGVGSEKGGKVWREIVELMEGQGPWKGWRTRGGSVISQQAENDV